MHSSPSLSLSRSQSLQLRPCTSHAISFVPTDIVCFVFFYFVVVVSYSLWVCVCVCCFFSWFRMSDWLTQFMCVNFPHTFTQLLPIVCVVSLSLAGVYVCMCVSAHNISHSSIIIMNSRCISSSSFFLLSYYCYSKFIGVMCRVDMCVIWICTSEYET